MTPERQYSMDEYRDWVEHLIEKERADAGFCSTCGAPRKLVVVRGSGYDEDSGMWKIELRKRCTTIGWRALIFSHGGPSAYIPGWRNWLSICHFHGGIPPVRTMWAS